MKKILVPTDFSENAMNALLFARELACTLDCKLTLLHTFQAPQRSDMLISLDDVLRQDAEEEMATFLERAALKEPPEVKILKGDSVRTIADFAGEGNFNLIVMGTKGASGLKEVFLGSITGGVMRHTPIPILAIPEDYTPRPIRNIAFAIANMELSGEEVVAPLKELTRRFDAKVHIFHSVKDKEEADQSELLKTAGWLEGLPHTFSIEEERGSLHESIKAFVKSADADMLCLVRRKHGLIGFFERLFKTSVTLGEVFHCELPLLVLHSE
ncbi:MAG: universal stress protein [Phaeodactylibacter sp.]|nr:universal stress protein [Phaeodactylibacter sp.]MCB9266675.1 universal stress protein [Lewinellaceae bacterium]MCB9289206.1 universal stress protein [Lewinellaceae bacterium]